ncbi:unnamed protein product [Chrysoparadoxa australica]
MRSSLLIGLTTVMCALRVASSFSFHVSPISRLRHVRHVRTRQRLRMTVSEAESSSTTSANAYDHAGIELKWQQYWEANQTFKTPTRSAEKEKRYVLDMFPYPSGSGLHVGHPEGYTASDVMARYWRMCGYDVLHPMGWDSFGLPAEQHAIQTGTHPKVTTYKNIDTFRRQLKMLGFSYDWERELATTDVGFVRWTQWIFLQLFKANLAEQSEALVNWCPALGTVLANEEIINGKSERGDHPVVRQPLRQWTLKITKYADKLQQGLSDLNWPDGTLTAQQQWIGKSEGASIDFPFEARDDKITAFTTRADTLMGVTYVVLAPEHPLVKEITTLDQAKDVEQYIAATAAKSDLQRTADAGSKEKTGVWTGASVLHPITKEPLPVWIGDYVLGSYGTGAVMAVPAHDERDFEFAKAFGMDIKQVGHGTLTKSLRCTPLLSAGVSELTEAFTNPGTAVNSGQFDGLTTAKCKKAIVRELETLGLGRKEVNYRLRDWIFSRQRYWGEPIPIYFPVVMEQEDGDPRKGSAHTIDYSQPIPVDESELPLVLPEMDSFEPGDDPSGCLARAVDWRYFQKDGKWFARETNTMPQWAGSCWYYLRFIDPANSVDAWSTQADQDWMPVDLYIGGQEHAVLHLLYARFWHKVLHDLGLVKDQEPFKRLVHQGMILGSDGEKMSKSRGNVVNPDDIVGATGADSLRLYEMFMGPLEATKPWQTSQVSGVVRFRDKVYNLCKRNQDLTSDIDEKTRALLHKTAKKVTSDIDTMSFNTAISALMVLTNHLTSMKAPPMEAVKKLCLMVAPFAPHLGEECWSLLHSGSGESLAYEPWVTWNEEFTIDSTVNMGVQVNGKLRADIEIAKDASEDEAREAALKVDNVKAYVEGKELKKFIYVSGRIISFVVGK